MHDVPSNGKQEAMHKPQNCAHLGQVERLVRWFKRHKTIFVILSCGVCFQVPFLIKIIFNIDDNQFLLFFWGGMVYQSSLYWIKDNSI